LHNPNSIKNKTIAGVFWNFTDIFLRRGLNGLTTIILAWLLAPSEFGLIAMIAVFLAVADALVEGGFKQALIRKNKFEDIYYSSAWLAQGTMAVVVYITLYLVAPAIAQFYGEPILELMVRVVGITVIINSLYIVQSAALTREMAFKQQLKVSLPASVISGIVAVTLAYFQYGVWALITQTIVMSMCNCLFYWKLRIWRASFRFSLKACVDLLRFGSFLLLERLTQIPFRYMYVVVIAKMFSAPVAGLYYLAEKLREIAISQLVSSIETVTYPALVQLQGDGVSLKGAYRNILSVTTFVVFPSFIFLAALADPLFSLILPEKWSEVIPLIQLISLASVLVPLHSMNLNILKVKGRSDLVFYIGLVKKGIAILILLVSFSYGVTGILIGQVINSIIGYLPNSIYAKKLLDYSPSEQMTDFLPTLLLASIIGVIVWWGQNKLEWHSLSELLILGGLGVVVYIWASWRMKLKGLELAANIFKDKVWPKKFQ